MPPRQTLAYLGPAGSFSHQAAQKLAPADVDLSPYSDLGQVIEALLFGRSDFAVAAINSAAGPITATIDLLASKQVQDLGRILIDVSFDLYRSPMDTDDLVGVLGHEKALAQISDWITRAAIESRSVSSNTLGLQMIKDGEPGWGAVGPPGLGPKFGLEVTEQALESPNRNQTEFILLARSI